LRAQRGWDGGIGMTVRSAASPRQRGCEAAALASTSSLTTAHEPGASSATDSCRGVIKSLFRSRSIRSQPQPASSSALNAMDRPAKAARCSGES
jgi:hypothetical protein